MRSRLKWLLLPVIVVVVASATMAVRPGRTPEPAVATPSTSVLSESEIRDALSHPAAPLTFTRFDDEEQPLSIVDDPACWERPDDPGEPDLLMDEVTPPVYAPRYRSGDRGVVIRLMRVAPDGRETVAKLLSDPAQCHAEQESAALTGRSATVFPIGIGEAAVLLRFTYQDSEAAVTEAQINSARVVALSGPWIILADSESYEPEFPPSPDEEPPPPPLTDVEAVHTSLALPEFVRAALRPFDAAAGTTFSTPPAAPVATCTGESLGEDDLRGLTDSGVSVIAAVHDAACSGDSSATYFYEAPTYFANGEIVQGLNAHSIPDGRLPDLPALAEAVEAGPVPEAGGRLVYAARGSTFVFEKRTHGMRGFAGHSDQCGSTAAGADAVCDAARGRGVLGLDWQPAGMAEECDGLPVDIRQRMYVLQRSPTVPDVAVRSSCTPPSTGNWPFDVTVLDGARSAGDRAEVLSNLVNTGQGVVISELRWENDTIYIPVAGTLGQMNVDGSEYTVGLRWTASGYRIVSRE